VSQHDRVEPQSGPVVTVPALPPEGTGPGGDASAFGEAASTAVAPRVDARFGLPLGGVVSRVTWTILFAIPTAVVATAARLTPSPLGHGTHVQLGLPPCGFLVVTGYPCPGCGLTTAFANMAHFRPVEAAAANAFGVLLFLVTLFTIPIALTGALRGWQVVPVLERLGVERWAVVLALVSLTVWTTRLLTQFALMH
jgi:hypothetical protein